MLFDYDDDIQILSNKNVDPNQAYESLKKIKAHLPNSEKQLNRILEYATTSLMKSIKDGNYGKSFGFLRFIFFSSLISPMDEIKRQGAFRASKASFKPNLIKELVLELLASQTLSPDDQHYLQSVNGLLKIAPDIQCMRKNISAAAKSRSYFLKTILALAEIKYCDLLGYHDDRTEKPVIDLVFHKNKESILYAVSYVLQISLEELGEMNIKEFKYIDEGISDNYYHSIMEQAFVIRNYLEAEINVDFHDYEVLTDAKGEFFYVKNESFETAKSHGFTKTELRTFSQLKRYYNIFQSSGFYQTLEELWLRDSQENESITYTIEKYPIERIVVKALLANYNHEANIFGRDELFNEEAIQLMILADDNYNVDFVKNKICGEFTCLDILKVQRYFGFFSFIYRKAYERLKFSENASAEKIRKRSVLPFFDKELLINVFHSATGKSLGECEFLLDKLTNESITLNEIIDLQYKPIIKIEEQYMVMPTVFAHSNLVRSLALSEKVHLSVFDKKDHMVDSFSNTLIKQGFSVRKDFQFGVDEIDVAAVFDNHLFLFECKNPYHPVNDFELRNTYSHLKKGYYQLEKFRSRFNNIHSLNQFLVNIEVPPNSINNVHYGIVNANRALTGLCKNGITVFHANELMNFISTGTIVSGDKKLHCWSSDTFQIGDLISYMDGSVVTGDLISHKSPMPYWFKLRNHILYFSSFQFDLEKAHNMQAKKYRYLGAADLEGA